MIVNNKIKFFTGLALSIVVQHPALAACSQPIFPPLTTVRANWSDLENLKREAPQVAQVAKRQDLRDHGHGELNTDFYSVTIDANGQSAESLLREVRGELSVLIFDGAGGGLAPLNATQSTRWNSQAPLDAVMVFTLAELGPIAVEKGGVFVSCSSPTDFVFSTLTLSLSEGGLHPVAGNRAFGVHDHGDGSLSIYTKAADRVVDEGIFGADYETWRSHIFAQGDAIWRNYLNNLQKKFRDRNPRGKFTFSERVTY